MAVVKNNNWIRRFEVSDPKKHKNGFTVYKVTSVVFPKSAPEASTSVVVWKRYNDFKKLYESLKCYHKQCKISEELPQLCKGKYFKRFEENVIKDRMNFALDLLNFIGRHQILFTSDPFLQFFNNGYLVTESTSVVDENPEIFVNGNNLDLSSDLADDLKRNPSSPGCPWDSRSSNDSNSINCECSDEDSNITTDSPDSGSPASPIHSVDCFLSTKEKLDNCNSNNLDAALDIVENPGLVSDEIVQLERRRGMKEPTGETVTCHSEKPMEICLSVKSEDFRAMGESLRPGDLNEEWITPPGTPAGKQDYLVEAAYHVGQAQRYEVEGKFEAAFCFYKAAIDCLLSGVQDDDDKLRRQAVREKTNQYLQRAEKIYALHLEPEREIGPQRVTEGMEELKTYKVLDVIDSVMLVMSKTEKKCYVIKVLQKSPCPVDTKKKNVIPYNVPYMVKLIKYFENDNSIFLILEYARGGKLWDHLRNFSAQGRALEDTEFYSCSSRTSQYELSDAKVRNEIAPSITLQPPDDDLVLMNETKESIPVSVDLEVTNLLEKSQKLLNSVSKTLLNSERITSNLNRELSDIETVFDLKCRLLGSDKPAGKFADGRKKRSRSAVLRSKFERSYSTEDLTDSRPRTASNSVDRRSEWSKLESPSPRIPESVIRGWAAELLVVLETLHRWGIVCRDLHPGNILLGDDDHILLTFQAHWKGVDALISDESFSGLYAAPENMSVFPITTAADWWSFGALLYYLLTGKTLSSCHPEGIFGHTMLTFPDYLSPEASSLLRELLRYEPGERLGSGVNGAEDIKCHPFFSAVDWRLIYDHC